MRRILLIIFILLLTSCVTIPKNQHARRDAIISFFDKNNIDVTFCNMEWGGLAYFTSGRVELSLRTLSLPKNVMWSVVIHEASHIILYREGKQEAYIDTYKEFVNREKQTDLYAKNMMSQLFPNLKYWGYYITANGGQLCETYLRWADISEEEGRKECRD